MYACIQMLVFYKYLIARMVDSSKLTQVGQMPNALTNGSGNSDPWDEAEMNDPLVFFHGLLLNMPHVEIVDLAIQNGDLL